MSFPQLVHNTVAAPQNKRRSSLLYCPRHRVPTPIPPTLVNSPHLSSPNSVFRRKSSVLRWPSQQNDEWLRDMIPMDTSGADSNSERSNDSSTPSPTSSDSSHTNLLFPPSPMLRPRSTSIDIPTPGKLALCSPGLGQSPHS